MDVDGGNRRFILVEMEPKIAQEITAERVKRVALGYTNAKGEKAEHLARNERRKHHFYMRIIGIARGRRQKTAWQRLVSSGRCCWNHR